MHSRRSGAMALAVLVLVTCVIFGLSTREVEWQPADKCVPKQFSTDPIDSRPVLVSSAPLPGATIAAKPVIAADCCQTVVVTAQYVKMGCVGLPVWRSRDCGATWEPARQLRDFPGHTEFNADPWLVTDGRGRYYCVHASARPAWPVLRRSSDGGEHWSDSVIVATGVDRPVLGVNAKGKPLVMAASVAKQTRFFVGVFISRDRGNSWNRLSSPVHNSHAIPFSVVVADGGRIALACVAAGSGSRSVIYSTVDYGCHWAEKELVANLQPDRVHPFNGERFPVLAVDGENNLHAAFIGSRAKSLYACSSRDWTNWLAPQLLSDSDAEEIRMPAIASQGSRVHVLWLERRGRRWKTYYRGSRDMGRSWSEKVHLSVPTPSSRMVNTDGFSLFGDDDQACITDDGQGTVHAVWAVGGSNGSDSSNIWHAVVRWRRPGE
jgi:hypothetical protein